MKQALSLATNAAEQGEVPVGALLVYGGEVIASSGNTVESQHSVLGHAELITLQKASEAIENWRLTNCTLYVTLEPCTMCASAIRLSRVSRVVFGAPDIRYGGFGSLIDLSELSVFGPPPEITAGILKEESSKLLREFFKKRREETE